jgi:hypothetical protein
MRRAERCDGNEAAFSASPKALPVHGSMKHKPSATEGHLHRTQAIWA